MAEFQAWDTQVTAEAQGLVMDRMLAEAGRISIGILMAGVSEISDPEMVDVVPCEMTTTQTIIQLADDILYPPFKLRGTVVPHFLLFVALY